jgi:hypothetical protein
MKLLSVILVYLWIWEIFLRIFPDFIYKIAFLKFWITVILELIFCVRFENFFLKLFYFIILKISFFINLIKWFLIFILFNLILLLFVNLIKILFLFIKKDRHLLNLLEVVIEGEHILFWECIFKIETLWALLAFLRRRFDYLLTLKRINKLIESVFVYHNELLVVFMTYFLQIFKFT